MFTEASPPAGWAGTGPADMVTGCPVLTLALLLTVRTKVPLATPLLTLCTFVASLTQAEATDGITAPMARTAVARVDAIRPPVPVVTGSLAAEARPPRGTAAASSGRVAVSVVGASTPHLAAGSKPACWAGILAAASNEAREAQAGSGLRVAAGTVFTRRADLLTAKPPAALGTICSTVLPGPPRWAQTLSRDPVAGGPHTGAGTRAARTKRSCWALLATVLALVAWGTLHPTLATHRVAGHTQWAGTTVSASWPEEAWLTLCLAVLAPEASLAGAAAIPRVTRLCV